MGASLLSLTLALPGFAAPPEGKGGGKGGDSGGGGGADTVLDAPISYTKTELRWFEDRDPNFGGLFVSTVNRDGLTTGWVQRPDGFMHGVVNVGLTGEATNTMVDLNEWVATSLAAVASGWRIAYVRGINDDGLVGCELIPATEPEKNGETVPIVLAVADLTTRDLTLVDPGVSNPDFLIQGMNRHGDLLVSRDVAFVEDGYNRWGNTLYVNSSAPGEVPIYEKNFLDDITEYRPAFNSALQIASVTYGRQYVQRRYDFSDPNATIETWRAGRKNTAFTQGIAEDGTVYVRESGNGGPVMRVTITEAGETVASPLTVEVSSLLGYRNRVSLAQEPGEEEMAISTGGVRYLYKPSYGLFPFPADPVGSLDNVNISPPHDPESGQNYIGGYIIYEDVVPNVRRSFLLTPEGATSPTVL